MVTIHEVERQLKQIGCNFRFFGRPEIRELAKILLPGERIAQATNGFYEGGFALLVVTDDRLLLIDRKPMFLTIEDLRFDMIAEIDFNHRLLNATVNIHSTNKSLRFTAWNHQRLRTLVQHLQHRVMQIRHQHAQAVGEHVHTRMQEQFAQFGPQTTSHAQQYVAVPEAEYVQASTQQPAQEEVEAVAPSLAYLAIQGGGVPVAGMGFSPGTAVPSYQKKPTLSRRRKFPNFY